MIVKPGLSSSHLSFSLLFFHQATPVWWWQPVWQPVLAPRGQMHCELSLRTPGKRSKNDRSIREKRLTSSCCKTHTNWSESANTVKSTWESSLCTEAVNNSRRCVGILAVRETRRNPSHHCNWKGTASVSTTSTLHSGTTFLGACASQAQF